MGEEVGSVKGMIVTYRGGSVEGICLGRVGHGQLRAHGRQGVRDEERVRER